MIQINLVIILIILVQITSICGEKHKLELPFGYVTRSNWNAKLPKRIIEDTHENVSIVIITHTLSDICDTPNNKQPCDVLVRSIQETHLSRSDYLDIGFNFLIGGDGKVYEGQGWYSYGVHTQGYNDKSRAIAFIGRYHEKHEEPTRDQVDAALALIQQGIALGIIKEDYRLYGQRTLMATDSPGDMLFEAIKSWKGFTEIKEID